MIEKIARVVVTTTMTTNHYPSKRYDFSNILPGGSAQQEKNSSTPRENLSRAGGDEFADHNRLFVNPGSCFLQGIRKRDWPRQPRGSPSITSVKLPKKWTSQP
jgi:hypothetical protein